MPAEEHRCQGLTQNERSRLKRLELSKHVAVPQADIVVNTSPSAPRRLAASAVSFLVNRVPAAVEAALVRDGTFSGTPYSPRHGSATPSAAALGQCAAGATLPRASTAAGRPASVAAAMVQISKAAAAA